MANQADLIQNFIDNCNAVIYLKDEEGRFLMVNGCAGEMLKVAKEELLGKTDYDFFSKEDADKFRANDRKVANVGTPMNFKETHTFAGKQITILDHKFPVSVEGHPNAVGGIVMDITNME